MFNDSYKKGDNNEGIFLGNRMLRLIEARKSSEEFEINVTRLSDLAI